ncbi:MAG: hypothetical protein H7329_02470 [Opitutaceae bacterium]|nr:hypothetical protein [Cytophagales bacterium]
MKLFIFIISTWGCVNMLKAQPPGSPKDMPGSDTSTVEMDGGKRRDKQTVQRSDTANKIPRGPKHRRNSN